LASTLYDRAFFDDLHARVYRSARAIVPLVLDVLHPASVIDIGCGTGTWLAAFVESGVHSIVGVDGDYVDRTTLEIPAMDFIAHDLTTPFVLDRRFDLVVSLEVAEHLPRASAGAFVAALVALGPAILFSAAIPGQGGVAHVNEQWQDYWARLFLMHGYDVVDIIRPAIWSREDILPWYAQNTLLYVNRDLLEHIPVLCAAGTNTWAMPLRVVHPTIFRGYVGLADIRRLSLRRWGEAMPYAFANAARRQLNKLRSLSRQGL